ncbi:MAG TPA: helix-turn-helix domain-containing protein [Caulobacteraceae bacterium]|nr:helix-turn-helix domain-containing protein [Caulobacteraceae bacterium]
MTSDASAESPRRRPKGDKRARTRAKLIEVAAQLVEEKGYEHATLQEVARRAGLSNGAVYGNFKNREDLLAAIGPTYWPQVRPQVSAGASVAEIMRAVAEALIEVMPARAKVGAGRLRGLAYGLGNDALKARVAEVAAGRYAAAARWWRERFPDETQLPMPAEDLVRVISALAEGLTFQRLATPELIPDEVIYAAFATLAGERSKPLG